jgi:hypothetical protein
MSIFAIIFAVVILSFFWGGFVYMLLYSLKLKGQPGQAGDDDEEADVVESGVEEGKRKTDDR